MSVGLVDQRDALSVICRYARSVDAADIEALLQCFTADVSLSYEGGLLRVNGRAEAEDFFRRTLRGPSTHLLSNHSFGQIDRDITVSCSAIACICRKEGFVTLRGLVYDFTCVRDASGLSIRRLAHSSTWECDVPGGPR